MKKKFLIGLFALLAFAIFGPSHQASAVSNVYPDRGGTNPIFKPGDPAADGSILLIKRGGEYQLNVPIIGTTIFFDPYTYTTGNTRVFIQPVTCDAGSSIRVTPRFIPPGDHPDYKTVEATPYTLNCGSGNGATVFDTNNMGTNRELYGADFKIGQLIVELLSGPGTRFEYRVIAERGDARVTFTEPSFETTAYTGLAVPSAVVRSNFQNLSNDYDGYSFDFAVPSCYPYEGFHLLWTDDDQGASNQPQPISFDLFDLTTGQLVSFNPSPPGWGGNSDNIRSVHIPNSTALKGHKLQWRWQNVYRTNGIQIIPPFSQIYLFNSDCGPKEPDHKALLSCTTDAGSGTFKVGTTVTCNAGMINRGSGDGPGTAVELLEYNKKGASTDQFCSNVPGPGLDSKLTAYYGCNNDKLFAGNAAQPHYVWIRSKTPHIPLTDHEVHYQPVKFKVKAGTPDGTKLCFVVRVTALENPSDATSDDSDIYCYIVGSDEIPNEPSSDCPPLPNPEVDVTLPDTVNEVPAPSGETSSPNMVQYQITKDGKTKVTSTDDISDGGNKVGSPNFRLRVVKQSYQSATIDYQRFINSYPYDYNRASVTYDSYYTKTKWQTSSKPDRYDCGGGKNEGGSQCSQVYDATITGYTPKVCGGKKQPPCKPVYKCNPGDTAFGSACLHTYTGSPRYNWNKTNDVTSGLTVSNSVNAKRMDPCFDRTHDATVTTVNGTLDDVENPGVSEFRGTLSVQFNVPYPDRGEDSMRRASRIELPYTISYYIKRARGGQSGTTDMPPGTASITAASSNKKSSGSRGVAADFRVQVGGNVQVGDSICWILTTTALNGPARARGTVDIEGAIKSGTRRHSLESCTLPIVNRPYLRVYGGDVMAGGGFGVGCSVNNGAGILGWNRGDGAGSGTQLAAQAASAITEFSSATTRTTTPTPPSGLSFGNTSGTYGGNFGSGSCAKDYWSARSNVQTSYSNNGQTVADATHPVTFVNGDAFIRGNIVYANTTGWTAISRIPSFYLVVRGNIYIDPSVTQLDGVYVAMPDPGRANTGRIYTCAQGSSIYTTDAAFDACNRKLTINGVFMAQQVRFLRTIGSLRDSRPDEQAASGTIAEVFNYSPELFLVNPRLFTEPPKQYESATSLPPVL